MVNRHVSSKELNSWASLLISTSQWLAKARRRLKIQDICNFTFWIYRFVVCTTHLTFPWCLICSVCVSMRWRPRLSETGDQSGAPWGARTAPVLTELPHSNKVVLYVWKCKKLLELLEMSRERERANERAWFSDLVYPDLRETISSFFPRSTSRLMSIPRRDPSSSRGPEGEGGLQHRTKWWFLQRRP